jgi:hypothetical protein
VLEILLCRDPFKAHFLHAFGEPDAEPELTGCVILRVTQLSSETPEPIRVCGSSTGIQTFALVPVFCASLNTNRSFLILFLLISYFSVLR